MDGWRGMRWRGLRADDGLFLSSNLFGFQWADDGQTIGFLQSVRADDGLFSLLAYFAFGRRTMGFP